jgi:predicted nucleic acid-binding protein
MGILTAIQGNRIYLDVNIWIYALEQHPTFSQVLTELFQQVDQKTCRPNLRVIPVQRAILIEAARQRATSRSLKLPDAIHVATAVILNCTTLLTNDQKFKSLSNLPVVILSEVVTTQPSG